jgi:hypothetical protein
MHRTKYSDMIKENTKRREHNKHIGKDLLMVDARINSGLWATLLNDNIQSTDFHMVNFLISSS